MVLFFWYNFKYNCKTVMTTILHDTTKRYYDTWNSHVIKNILCFFAEHLTLYFQPENVTCDSIHSLKYMLHKTFYSFPETQRKLLRFHHSDDKKLVIAEVLVKTYSDQQYMSLEYIRFNDDGKIENIRCKAVKAK